MDLCPIDDTKIVDEDEAVPFSVTINFGMGTGFPDYLVARNFLCDSTFMLFAYFCGTSLQTDCVPASTDPVFVKGKVFPLRYISNGEALPCVTIEDLYNLDEQLHVVVVHYDVQKEARLLSSRLIDWRTLFLHIMDETCTIPLELYGVNTESAIKIGVVDLEVKLSPPMSPTSMCLKYDPEDLIEKICQEETKVTEKEKMFLTYTKIWWREYLDIRATNAERYVKLFAQDENGRIRPVVSYVKPINLKFYVETPNEAAWYVSLFKHRTPRAAGHIGHNSCLEQWSNFNTFLSVMSGDTEDHAVFLCSLLLGFGLDAYVCLGTLKGNEPYAWVMTFGRNKKVTFWDPLNATKYCHLFPSNNNSKNSYPFSRLGCVFNHSYFFANNHVTDCLDICNMNLCDRARWKRMSFEAINLVRKIHPDFIRVLPPRTDGRHESCELEFLLKSLIIEYRKDKCLGTCWNEDMNYILSASIALYEQQGKSGICGGESEILDAIHKIIPEGFNFKALPIHFLHSDSRRIFQDSTNTELGQIILSCDEDQTHLSVAARIYTYPQTLTSVWVMYGVAYSPPSPEECNVP